jgi:hypothetical protein
MSAAAKANPGRQLPLVALYRPEANRCVTTLHCAPRVGRAPAAYLFSGAIVGCRSGAHPIPGYPVFATRCLKPDGRLPTQSGLAGPDPSRPLVSRSDDPEKRSVGSGRQLRLLHRIARSDNGRPMLPQAATATQRRRTRYSVARSDIARLPRHLAGSRITER